MKICQQRKIKHIFIKLFEPLVKQREKGEHVDVIEFY